MHSTANREPVFSTLPIPIFGIVHDANESLDFFCDDNEPEIPKELIPNETMRQNFINNCKDMGVW